MKRIKIYRLKWWGDLMVFAIASILGMIFGMTSQQIIILGFVQLILVNIWLLADGLSEGKDA
ncbi:hypothetical protein ACA593_10370 [Lactiplantibacillus pentosus]|uniref:hypothetical protein n=1 Tax=Lactiplantibacillus pentosus TaxID=1589 RepID=UPI000C7AABA8|nr:hypothetical protein [Lactiplantibacillus pentosus]AUI79101.1 hypothetical protein BB562_10595 [Lactiplantibacillus pentosus]MBO9163987.1 hypothetical protein [Lactiplantibacillus pentosus]MCE6031755.1 hypothetical protein [Lactiplantibacillus pentosus]MCT3278784.1 hypothetical protein [Lactiplantibacillus pentosus]